MGLRRFGIFGVSVLFVLLIGTTVMAQVPYKVTLAPIFRPGVQLDSDGGDIRYVNVDLVARSNIEYWAVQVSCTINKAVLENPFFTAGSVWNGVGGFVQLPHTFTPTGVFTQTISLRNPSTPIGGNDTAILLGTINFQVKPLAAAMTSTFVCTSSFLDRNGVVVAPTTYVAPAPLSVLPGYQISGTVTYQGRAATANAGIKVTCGTNPSVLTNAAGAFVISGRTAGATRCVYENAEAVPYLAGQTWVQLGDGGARIPPVSLPGGNPDAIPATYLGEYISTVDLGLVTANFGALGTTATAANGNINGDTKIDQVDVALVTANFDTVGPVAADHLLVSYARDYASPSNKKAFLVHNSTGTLTQALTGTSKVYHAKLSPDGTKIAYVSEVAPAVVNLTNPLASKLARYALFVAPAPGLAGAPVRVTPANWTYDAFFPSWSADGTTLAFVCSLNGGYEADWYNDGFGNLCTINPSGQNLSIRPEESELFFPSWYGNDGVIYSQPDYGLYYTSVLGTIPSTFLGSSGHMPILRGSVVYYLNNTYDTIIIASSGIDTIFNPFNVPSYGTTASGPSDPFNQDLTALGEIEAYEVSDLTQMIYVKLFDSNMISSYQFNGNPVAPSTNLMGNVLLPQYAYVSCSCTEALFDSIDYTP